MEIVKKNAPISVPLLGTDELENFSWNVVDEEEFKTRVRNVFKVVAGMLTRTLGPGGSNTIIEKFGDIVITKDGWNIVKKIQFAESIDNTIMHLLVNICAQVVIKVGDGSTSSVVAANEVLLSIESVPELLDIRPKDLSDLLSKIALKISEEILRRSTKIDPSNNPQWTNDVYRLALVSTNNDVSIASMIQDIYKLTVNPNIDYIKSDTNRTHYEIIEGYQAHISFMDNGYINNPSDGTCDINAPIILMFDHKIDKENHYDLVIVPVLQKAIQENRQVVVIAPRYDDFLLSNIRTQFNIEVKSTGKSTVVYARAALVNKLYQEFYSDFSIMTGGRVISENDMIGIINATTETIDEFIGYADYISIGGVTTTIKGFPLRNQNMYDIARNDAIAKYHILQASNEELNIVTPELYEMKKRISKLTCLMGIIYVGGNSSLEKSAYFDLVEDAVRSCESAFSYGYNIGGNLIIPIIIEDLIVTAQTDGEKLIYQLFSDAFRAVFAKVVKNQYKRMSDDDVYAIVDQSIAQKECFNLVTGEYSTEVINPCFTDIEIIKACTSIVSLLMSSNQFLTINTHSDIK